MLYEIDSLRSSGLGDVESVTPFVDFRAGGGAGFEILVRFETSESPFVEENMLTGEPEMVLLGWGVKVFGLLYDVGVCWELDKEILALLPFRGRKIEPTLLLSLDDPLSSFGGRTRRLINTVGFI